MFLFFNLNYILKYVTYIFFCEEICKLPIREEEGEVIYNNNPQECSHAENINVFSKFILF